MLILATELVINVSVSKTASEAHPAQDHTIDQNMPGIPVRIISCVAVFRSSQTRYCRQYDTRNGFFVASWSQVIANEAERCTVDLCSSQPTDHIALSYLVGVSRPVKGRSSFASRLSAQGSIMTSSGQCVQEAGQSCDHACGEIGDAEVMEPPWRSFMSYSSRSTSPD